MKNFGVSFLLLGFIGLSLLVPQPFYAQCLVGDSNLIYIPNPSNIIEDNGTEFVKLYLHICERFQTDPTLSDAEVASIITQVNSDFFNAKIEFFYCLERHYDPDFVGDGIYTAELSEKYGHDDGIDVYLMPKEYYVNDNASFSVLNGGGLSFNVGNPTVGAVAAQEVIIWGKTTTCGFPFFPTDVRFVQVPHVLSHELGHCLGLVHPHETFPCPDLDGVNCTTCGDMLCETQPSRNLRYCVNDECQNVSHFFNCNPFSPFTYVPDPNLNPDLNNIMAYTNYFSCSPIFFDEQNTRMMATLQNNPLLQNFRFKFISGNVNVNASESWPQTDGFPPSGNAYITGNLNILPGGDLTITKGRIQFSPTSKVSIQARGRLALAGSTLTSWCDYWQGVEVLGNSSAQQSLNTHGKFESSEGAGGNARIENAITGVKSLNGGIVTAYETTFSNNLTGVQFSNYTFPIPITWMEGCDFETTGKDKFTTPSFGGRSHLSLLGISSTNGLARLNVVGCEFKNDANTFMSNPTTHGISSFFSNYTVTNAASRPSSFTNLLYGVISVGNANRSIVQKSNFQDCSIGIFDFGTQSFFAKENNFYMGVMPSNPPPSILPNQFGVWLLNATPIAQLTGNKFYKTTPSSLPFVECIGSFAQNLGDFNNVFSKNEYHGIDIANLANENNGGKAGLHYLCNKNFGPQLYDFAVEQDATVRQDQGEGPGIGGNFKAAGNTFSYTNGNNGDFSDFNNEGGGLIRYYWRNAPNEEPLDFLNIFKNQSPTPASCSAPEICPEPCRTTSEITAMKSEYFTRKNAWLNTTAAASQAQQTGNAALAQQYEIQANGLKDRMDYLVGSILSEETGTLNRQDTIRKWLGQYERVSADFFVAKSFFQEGHSYAADSILQLIPSKFTLNAGQLQEVSSMRQLVTLLAGKDIFALDATTKAALLPFTANTFSSSGDWARSILMYYGNSYLPTYKLPGGGERSQKVSPSQIGNSFRIYPNPAKDVVSLQLQEISEPLDIELIDSFGRILEQKKLSASENSSVFYLSSLPSGIYFMRVKQLEGNTYVEKLIINN